jgi:hypothetical protein
MQQQKEFLGARPDPEGRLHRVLDIKRSFNDALSLKPITSDSFVTVKIRDHVFPGSHFLEVLKTGPEEHLYQITKGLSIVHTCTRQKGIFSSFFWGKRNIIPPVMVSGLQKCGLYLRDNYWRQETNWQHAKVFSPAVRTSVQDLREAEPRGLGLAPENQIAVNFEDWPEAC